MRHIKPFLVTFTALVLICSIPISSSALGDLSPFDADMAYYSYDIEDEDEYLSTASSVWYNVTINGIQQVGRAHFNAGHVEKCFFVWIPFMGLYLVTVQTNPMRYDWSTDNGNTKHFYYCWKNSTNPDRVHQTQSVWYGDGFLSNNNKYCFQDVFFGYYFVFFRIYIGNNQPNIPERSSLSAWNYKPPSGDEADRLRQYLNGQSGQDKPFPDNSDSDGIVFPGAVENPNPPTYPNGQTQPTDPQGNPLPTDQYGSTLPTLPNGMPTPTYPNGQPAITYYDPQGNLQTVPWDPDFGQPWQTIIWSSQVFTIPPWMTLVTDENGDPQPDPLNPSQPWVEEVTIYNNENGKSDINGEFSKIYGMISDIDNLSSLAESNQAILSSHVDDTRNLISDITSWLPTPIIACMVCGAIMIIAVKITGSGKS